MPEKKLEWELRKVRIESNENVSNILGVIIKATLLGESLDEERDLVEHTISQLNEILDILNCNKN